MSEEVALASADLATVARLRARIAALESQLGTAHAEITRLEEARSKGKRQKEKGKKASG